MRRYLNEWLYPALEHWSEGWRSPGRPQQGRARGYLQAVLLVAMALALRLVIAPVDAGLQYITFFPAVALAALVGGLRAGLLATALGMALATVVFTAPYFSLSTQVLQRSLWSNLVFLADGVIVSGVIEGLHRFRARSLHLLQAAREAQQQVQAQNQALQAHLAERAKVEAELRLAAMAFETHEAIMITDARASIIRVNKTFEQLTGYRSDEVLGRNPRLLNSGRHDAQFFAAMWASILSTGTWSGEIWDRHKSGSLYPKEMTVHAVKNAQGETTEYMAIFSDISHRKRAEAEVHGLAFLDALTGLPNRRLLYDRLAQVLSALGRNDHHGALLFLDMDHFKAVNDGLGHDHGDLLLVEIANRLKSCVRAADTVARMGGDEFVVVLANLGADPEQASRAAAHVAETVRAVLATPYQLGQVRHHNSASVGACVFRGHCEPAHELVKRADIAMYQAKESGRNRVVFFDPRLQQAMVDRGRLEAALREAVAAQQFRLHFELQFDAQGRPFGAQALLRWQHPERGLLLPSAFMSLAQASELAVDIGRWMLDAACAQLLVWRDQPHTANLVLSIEVTARQFEQRDFVDRLAATLLRLGLDPSRLTLELDETIVQGEMGPVLNRLATLKRELGVVLSLGGRGAAQATLARLERLPIDRIQLAAPMVQALGQGPHGESLARSVIDLARNFGLAVVAEGVDTEAQLAWLRQLGCLACQGAVFGAPVTAHGLDAQLRLAGAPAARHLRLASD